MSQLVFRTGAVPDPYDPRDLPLFSASEILSIQPPASGAASIAATENSAAGTAASSVKLDDLPPVYNQGDIGSCVANACLAALRFAWKKATKGEYKDFEPSRLFSYYYGRVTPSPADMNENGSTSWMTENIKNDTGTWNRAVIHSFLMQGVCKEELWPYGTPKSDQNPGLHPFIDVGAPPNVYEPKDWATVNFQARPSSHVNPKGAQPLTDLIPRAISYYRIFDSSIPPAIDTATQRPTSQWAHMSRPTTVLLEKTIRSGWPIVFSTRIYENYHPYWQTTNGVFAKPPTDPSTLVDKSGHAMVIVGFDSTNRRFLIQNSWGMIYTTDGKQSGCFWMPYEWFEINVPGWPAVSDFWVIKYAEPVKK